MLPTKNGVGPSCIALPPGPWPTIIDFLVERFEPIPRDEIEARMLRGDVLDAKGGFVPSDQPFQAHLKLYYYRDIAEFRRINPKCCSLTHKHPYMGSLELYEFLDRLIGEKSTYVEIVYQFRYRDSDGQEKIRFILEGVAIKNCGEPWHGGY